MTEIVVDLPRAADAGDRETLVRLLCWVTPGVRAVRVRDRLAVVDYEGAAAVDDVLRAMRSAATEIMADGPTAAAVERRRLRVSLHTPARTDPFPDLVERGLVGEDATGSFTLTGAVAGLFEALDTAFLRRLRPLGPRPVRLPALLAPGTLLRSGALTSTPHLTHYVFHLGEGRDVPARFTERGVASADGALDLSTLATTADTPDAVLSTAACQPYFRALRDRTLDGTRLVTARATSYRFESAATEGLRRAREFTVRELVCVGEPDVVDEHRERLLAVVEELALDLGLSSRVATASDAFFVDTSARMRTYQLSFETKHELLAELPFDGSEIAVGSVNHHGDHFGTAWNIRAENGGTVHSCCLGLGLERWCYAVIAQYGLDPGGWPDVLRPPPEDPHAG